MNEYIKSTEGIFLPTYEKLFNSVFDSGNIPNAWLEGVIIPIYKHKGDSNVAANYRPITILSCLGKLFTAVLNQRLTKYLDENETVNENQAGFRKGYGVTDHIFVLYSLIEIMKKVNKNYFAHLWIFRKLLILFGEEDFFENCILTLYKESFCGLSATCMKILSHA